VVVALIGVPMITMIKATKMRWWSWVVVVSSMVLVCFMKVSPIYILICTIVVAAFISWWNNRRYCHGPEGPRNNGSNNKEEGRQ
jgi:chromate transport protein ChrA